MSEPRAPLPPAARRAMLLGAAALVALATLAYAFAERPPEESVDTPLAADGARVAEARAEADADCLAVEGGVLARLSAALRVGCASVPPDDGAADAPNATRPAPTAAPTPPEGAPDAPEDGRAPTVPLPTTTWPPATTTPVRPPSPPASEAEGAPAGGEDPDEGDDDGDGAPPMSPTSPTPPAQDASWWWGPGPAAPPGPWPEAFYDALAPVLSSPGPTGPPAQDGVEGASPPEGCATVCDPRSRAHGRGTGPLGAGASVAAEHLGLLARALDAADAYVRMRG